MKIALSPFIALSLVFGPSAYAQHTGVVSDPDVGLRVEQNTNAPVIATLKVGEPFSFRREQGADWCKVTLPSGPAGWVQGSAIRLHYTAKDLPDTESEPENPSELATFARQRGFNYDAVVRAAVRGDAKALKRFFAIEKEVDGAAAESHAGVPTIVYHLLGDPKFAAFLKTQPVGYWTMVRNSITTDSSPPVEIVSYLRRHFPETAKVLFRREIVDWPSPNGRYAVRKVFPDEFDLTGSKVARAELIEKESGRLLYDMTADDIGFGKDREGEVIWSPDSKRVACLSANLKEITEKLLSTPPPTPQKKQTAVYQVAGESFTRVEMPLNDVPGREKDAEVAGATLGHEFTHPVRWTKPDVLILQRHEYYQKLKPSSVEGVEYNAVHSFGRLYQITATIKPDGKAALAWKLKDS